MRLCSLLLLSTLFCFDDVVAQRPDSAARTASYLDASAAELVRLARDRRQVADLSVVGYKALSKERISVGLRGIRRDRLLYRREVAGRIEWTRDGPARIEVLGAREAVPVVIKGVQLPSDLTSFMPRLAFDPADNRMLIGWGDNDFVRHPLATNAEQFYRYKTGGTTSIQLPDGRVVRLIELEIIPRQADPHNITGSFWLDAETHSVVQASFRLARDLDIIRDLEDEDDDDVPGFVKPLRASVDHVTIEYGLYDLKWWMPRLIMFEGFVRAGLIRMSMQYERTYAQYEIEALAQPMSLPIAEVLARDSALRAETDSCQNRMSININIGDERNDKRQRPNRPRCGRWEVVVPTDTAALLNSSELPADPFAGGEQLITEGELRELGERIGKLGGGPQLLPQPVTDFGLLSIQHMRFNRIEGLSVAAKGSLDFGAYALNATARLGLADLEPNFELAAQRPGNKVALTLGGYRRLNSVDPFTRPFTIGSSFSALFLGRDEADYYRTLGVELKAEPSGAQARWYALRLFAQKESVAEKETDFSVRHLFNDAHTFRSNIVADKVNAYGAELTLRASRGLDPDGLRLGAELYGHAATGTFDFGRTALTVRSSFPLPGAFAGAIEGAAGVTSTVTPIQHLWYLGGPATLRGYNASVISGETFWRGRVEVGYGLPAVRLVGFSDAGWAGPRDDFKNGRPLLSVGAGASFLDGIVRFDVARGLRTPKGWTTTLYFDAAL